MLIKLICVGKLKEEHYDKAAQEYLKRIGRYSRVDTTEIREKTDRNIEVARKNESKLIISKLEGMEDYFKIALDSRGRQLTSEEFSTMLEKPKLVFIIGGPDGMTHEVLNKADFVLSLSKMTLPHQLARVFLLEQIYRGFTILKNEKYHK